MVGVVLTGGESAEEVAGSEYLGPGLAGKRNNNFDVISFVTTRAV